MNVEGALLEAPLSVKLLQAIFCLLLVVALIGTLVNYGPSVILLCGFTLVLVAIPIAQRRRQHSRLARAVPSVRFTPEAIFVVRGACEELEHAAPLRLQSVIRHWSGFTLTLMSKDGCFSHQKNQITIWRANWSHHDYRRLSVLINWHLRGQA